MKRINLAIMAWAGLLLVTGQLWATATMYTNRASFLAATSSTTNIDLTSASGSCFFNAFGLTVAGVNFVGINLGSFSAGANPYYLCVIPPDLLAGQAGQGCSGCNTPFNGQLQITLHGGITAIGFDYFTVFSGTSPSPVNFTVMLSTGDTFLMGTSGTSTQFIGFTSPTPITSLTYTFSNLNPVPSVAVGYFENITFGAATLVEFVKINLKPGGDPKCVNPGSNGNVPVAIFGSKTFDVTTINQSTLSFGGAPPLRCSIEDALMEGPTGVFTLDGIPDLVCHFSTGAVSWPATGTDHGPVILKGTLANGTPIMGSDIASLAGEPTCNSGTPTGAP